uniref:BURP domain-containing protein n=2 Tax=Aegilops tauschii subsp. strangulata TaxID=200361 RepID=A0A453NDE9_AEGTS
WKSEDAPSEKGFGESAYKVDWKLEDSTSKKNDFDGSAYVVHWDPNLAHSPSSIPEELEKRGDVKFQTGMLFLKKNLHIGTTLPEGTMFARDGAPKSIHFSSTPLESKYLTTILSYFKLPHGSMKANQVADTLHSCGKPADKEEPHMCFSSREAMARFATRELGVSSARAAITRIHGHENPSSMYVVEQITQLNSNVVPCHPMDFPYEVFYCHRPKQVQSLRVQLKDLKDGMSRVTAIAMCHMNTSDWDTQYFELLDGERGEPICHYMPTDYIMFY